VIHEVVGEELLEDLEVPLALHLFGVPPDDRLGGTTHVICCHINKTSTVPSARRNP